MSWPGSHGPIMSNYKTILGGIIRHQMAFSDANPGRSPVLLGGDAEIEKLREFGDFDRVAKTIGNCPDHGARGSEPLLDGLRWWNPGCLCWPRSNSLEIIDRSFAGVKGKPKCLCSLLHFSLHFSFFLSFRICQPCDFCPHWPQNMSAVISFVLLIFWPPQSKQGMTSE